MGEESWKKKSVEGLIRAEKNGTAGESARSAAHVIRLGVQDRRPGCDVEMKPTSNKNFLSSWINIATFIARYRAAHAVQPSTVTPCLSVHELQTTANAMAPVRCAGQQRDGDTGLGPPASPLHAYANASTLLHVSVPGFRPARKQCHQCDHR
jgi:hypothetical protein